MDIFLKKYIVFSTFLDTFEKKNILEIHKNYDNYT